MDTRLIKNKEMRICLAVTRFKPDLHEAISKNFVLLSKKLGETNQVLHIVPNKYSNTETDTENIMVLDSSRQNYNSILKNLNNIKRISFFFNNNSDKFDIFNIHIGPLFELGLFKILIKKKHRHKIFFTVWQPYLTLDEILKKKKFFLSNFFSNFHQFLLNSSFLIQLFKWSLKGFSQLIVQSKYQAEQIKNLGYSGKLTIIPNGLVESDVLKKEKNNEKKELLYIGHLKSAKGCNYLIELFSELAKIANVELIIAPSNLGNRAKIEKLISKLGIKDRVVWKDKIELYTEMAACDALVVPYQSSVGTSYFPNIILEAFSVGLPVITTKVGATEEIVSNNKTGVLINDIVGESAKIIADFLKQPKLCKQISTNQKVFFYKNFYIDSVVIQYNELFNNLAE